MDKKSIRFGLLQFAHRQEGFNIIEMLILIALVVVLALLVIPNMNLFLGVDRKINEANVESVNVRFAAMAYEKNTGKYPVNSDVLWHNPPQPGDYVSSPRGFYTFDVGTGRILDATTDTLEHIPVNPWTGIKWDYTSGTWVKQ